MNTNELHEEVMGINLYFRKFPKASSSLCTKTGATRKLKDSEITRLNYFYEGNPLLSKYNCLLSGEIIIEFKTDKEGYKLAKSFKKLIENPQANLKVTFKKI